MKSQTLGVIQKQRLKDFTNISMAMIITNIEIKECFILLIFSKIIYTFLK